MPKNRIPAKYRKKSRANFKPSHNDNSVPDNKWIVIVKEGQEVDVDGSLKRLKNRGYNVNLPIKIHTDRDNPLDRKNIAITFPEWIVRQLDSYGSRHRSVVVRNAIAWFYSTGDNYKDHKDPQIRGDSYRISLSLPYELVSRLDKLGRGERSYFLRVAVAEYLKSESMC